MRRFDRELRSLGKQDLKRLIDDATYVFQNFDTQCRRKRPAAGSVHSMVELRDWHLTDAVDTLRPPPKAQQPVLFAAMGRKLRIVLRRDGALFWSDIPAQAHSTERLAFALPFKHVRHIAKQWVRRNPWRDSESRSCLRLSTGDALMEFFDVLGEASLDDCNGKSRVKPRAVEADWNAVWAQPPDGGVAFDHAQLAKVTQQLLFATRHADQDFRRHCEEQREHPTERRQDHGALWFDSGVVRTLLRSFYCELEAPGFEALQFAIGRQDAATLVRALQLMSVGRRRELAKKAGEVVGPPRWSRVGNLNVITNGDVGFAFPAAEGRQPCLRVREDARVIARADWRHWEFAQRFPDQEVLLTSSPIRDDALARRTPKTGARKRRPRSRMMSMHETVSLDLRDGAPAFCVKNELGEGAHAIPLTNVEGLAARDLKFNLLDLARLASALSSSDVRCEVIGKDADDVFGMRLEQVTEDMTLRAWVARVP